MTHQELNIRLLEVSDTLTSVQEHPEYGIVTPDGTTHWGSFPLNANGTRYAPIGVLVDKIRSTTGRGRTISEFKDAVAISCRELGINADEYIHGLKFVQRNVVVSVLKPVDIANPFAPAPSSIQF